MGSLSHLSTLTRSPFHSSLDRARMHAWAHYTILPGSALSIRLVISGRLLIVDSGSADVPSSLQALSSDAQPVFLMRATAVALAFEKTARSAYFVRTPSFCSARGHARYFSFEANESIHRKKSNPFLSCCGWQSRETKDGRRQSPAAVGP